MEVVDMIAEMLKNSNRIQNSLMNVNKRLEEEIFKLKADLAVQTNEKKKLGEKLEYLETYGYRILRDCEGNAVGPYAKKYDTQTESKNSDESKKDS